MDTLNFKNLKNDFGLIIQTGTASLLNYPERKEGLKWDWAEENGTEYSLRQVFFKDKEVTLKCAILASSPTDFWAKYNAFFQELTKPEWQRLFIFDHDRTYEVFYKKSDSFQKTLKRLKNVPKLFVKFDLTLQVR
ncbi:hypothetical protein [Flavobacterium sp. HSC-61S13]|uniref:hypothetical protein n=1 Tax=Flavobacterium sp. HSC-61S13 TaxID=2910963 RepID=UPI00209E5E3C|nr:hypothetical protein [Flavobacterium sp. HSC-61S13]MCP1997303.1 hypothetical protein [Flavobacterium sp. HSC-61S13]